MTNSDKAKVKQLIKSTFWQFEDLADKEITPTLIRTFAKNNLSSEVIESTAINFTGADFWERVKNLCNLAKTARRFI